jgi:arylsulfatase A-like enzyme
VAGQDRRGYYVAQYDGEIAAADHEVGEVIAALRRSKVGDRTLVIVTSDHGESLGEHDYYFDHGENVFDPCLRIPLLISGPGIASPRRTQALASTLDLMPTILDAAKVSYPADLAGASLLPRAEGREAASVSRLDAQNDRDLAASFDRRFKTVRTPTETGARFALYDRTEDAGELHDVSAARADELRIGRRELELFLERADREWARTTSLIQGRPPEGEGKMSAEACEKMRALGYVAQCAP